MILENSPRKSYFDKLSVNGLQITVNVKVVTGLATLW